MPKGKPGVNIDRIGKASEVETIDDSPQDSPDASAGEGEYENPAGAAPRKGKLRMKREKLGGKQQKKPRRRLKTTRKIKQERKRK